MHSINYEYLKKNNSPNDVTLWFLIDYFKGSVVFDKLSYNEWEFLSELVSLKLKIDGKKPETIVEAEVEEEDLEEEVETVARCKQK